MRNSERGQVEGGCWLSSLVICCLISFSSVSSGSSDCFLFPYVVEEGMGMVVVTAMTCEGIPSSNIFEGLSQSPQILMMIVNKGAFL